MTAFSLGLASILVAIGAAIFYAKHLIPDSEHRHRSRLFRLLPIASACVIVVVGLLMTGVSLGWVPAGRWVS